LNGHPQDRLPGHLNLTFAGLDGAALLLALKEIALSAGSACASGSGEPSHVLRAIGADTDRAFSSLRFGLGRFNTADEVDYTAQRVVEEVGRLRQRASAAPRPAAPENQGKAPNATPLV
jgi:cysteine desulfurase